MKKTPQEIVDFYWKEQKKTFADFGIEFDNYSRTTYPVHHETSKDFFSRLKAK